MLKDFLASLTDVKTHLFVLCIANVSKRQKKKNFCFACNRMGPVVGNSDSVQSTSRRISPFGYKTKINNDLQMAQEALVHIGIQHDSRNQPLQWSLQFKTTHSASKIWS